MDHRMAYGSGLATAVVCIADEVFRDAVLNVAVEAGFIALSDVGRGAQIVDRVTLVEPAVIVLDLTLTGVDGLATVAAVHLTSPHTVIVVSTPFRTPAVGAFEVGAAYVVSEGDVAGVRSVFAAVAAKGNHRMNAPFS